MLHQASHNYWVGLGVQQIAKAHRSKTQAQPGFNIKGRERSTNLTGKKNVSEWDGL